MRVTFRWPVRKSSEARVHVPGSRGKAERCGDGRKHPVGRYRNGQKGEACALFQGQVLDSHQSEGINGVVRDCMEDDAIVFSDKSTSYVDISDLVELHVTEKSDAKTTKETLKWCISQSVMQNGHCWATTIKSKGNTYSCISTSLFTN